MGMQERLRLEWQPEQIQVAMNEGFFTANFLFRPSAAPRLTGIRLPVCVGISMIG